MNISNIISLTPEEKKNIKECILDIYPEINLNNECPKIGSIFFSIENYIFNYESNVSNIHINKVYTFKRENCIYTENDIFVVLVIISGIIGRVVYDCWYDSYSEVLNFKY